MKDSEKDEIVEELREKILEVVEPLVEKEGLVIYELFCYYGRKGYEIQLVLDKLDGRVSVDECVLISRSLKVIIESDELIKGDYILEISSPGAERRIRGISEFERFKGELVVVNTIDGLSYQGTIKNTEGDTIHLEVKDEDISIDVSDITKARLKVDVKKILRNKKFPGGK
jgi:ribosome maturation factor RimP